MKNNNSFSPEFHLPNQNIINQNNNDNNIEKQIEQNNALIKDNISFNNENNSINLSQSNTNKNKESIEQTELNDLNIAFLLPKDLQENLGVGEEGFNENELIIKDDENNSLPINNIKNTINQFNDYNFDINNNDILNKGDEINYNQENNKQYLNILNCNNLQGNINIINNSMNINDSNNTFNYSNNLFDNNNNFSNIGFIDFINPQNYFNNQEKEQQQMNYNNQNIMWGNNFNNNQLDFSNNNNNNYMNQINQLNYNQIQQQSNDILFLDYQNKFNNNNELSQNEAKKNKKKMIDEYTIEMFGRRGWICELCNNFNYETRKKCNRCHINKKPKKINIYLLSEKNKNINHKNDWYCTNCGNFNYFFRVVCNRCQRKKND